MQQSISGHGWARGKRVLPLLATLYLLTLGLAGAQTLSASTTTLQAVPTTGQASALAHGTTLNLTATVSVNGQPLTHGQVKFCNATATYCSGVQLLGVAQLTAAGTATLPLLPSIGVHTYKAVFAGTSSAAGSTSSTTTVTVTGTYATTAALAVAGVPGNYTLQTAVTSAGGPGPPAGTVEFVDNTNGGSLLSVATLAPATSGVNWKLTQEPTLPPSSALVPGDFNGDGNLDWLAVVAQNQLSVILGNGDGTFSSGPLITSLETPVMSYAVSDFNGDDKLDVAVTIGAPQNTVVVYLGKGDGTFTQGAPASNTGGFWTLVTGDFNRDGNADIAVADGTQIHLLLGNGDGTFSAGPLVKSSCLNFSAADFNNDGLLDLVVEDQNGATVLLNQGDGTFLQAESLPIGYAVLPAIADFDGDGILDMAGTAAVQDPHGGQDDGYAYVYLGAGDGSFRLATSMLVRPGPRSITAGDFNGDGIADLAVGNFYSNLDSTFLGNGDGTFRSAGELSSGQENAYFVLAADVNNDGASDLLTIYGAGFAIYLAQPVMNATATATGITIAGSGTHFVEANYLGNGFNAPAISAPAPLTAFSDPSPILTTVTLTASPSASAAYGQPVTLTAALVPGAGQGRNTDGEIVSFFAGRYLVGSAALQGGAATLAISDLPLGADELTATYAGDGTFVASTSLPLAFAVSGNAPATTTTLTLTVGGNIVSSVAAGQAVTFTASVLVNGKPLFSAGKFNLCDASAPYCADVNVLGSAQTKGGAASFQWVPPIGAHSYRAVFLPTASYAGSSSAAVPLTVTGSLPTRTALASTSDSGNYTLTATLTGYGTAGSLPSLSGTVAFTGLAAPASATLAPSVPGMSVSALPQIPAGNLPWTVAAADFNSDGILDLAITSDTENLLTIALGNGDGTFHAGTNVTIPPGINIAAADLNMDGRQDLVITRGYAPATVLLGAGDGTFQAMTESAIDNAFAFAVIDVNGDGFADLAVLTGANQVAGATSTIQLFLGQGDGTFMRGATLSNSESADSSAGVSAVISGDFNGDGKPDLSVGPGAMFIGNGDGTFTRTANNLPAVDGAADFNGDGKTDLYGFANGATLIIYLSNGDGSFTSVATSIPGSIYPPIVADYNHDGWADMAVAPSGNAMVYFGKGDGTFTQSGLSFASPLYYGSAADLNHDGMPDLLVPNLTEANTVSVFLTERTQTATASVSGITLQGGNNEIVTASYPGETNYQASASEPLTLVSAPLPAKLLMAPPSPGRPSIYGQPVTLSATLNPYLTTVHSSDGEVVTFNAGGHAAITATLASGVATVTTSALPVGTYNIIAGFAGDGYLSSASSVRWPYSVNPATPSITFTVPNHSSGDAPFAIAATSNSDGAITYSVVSGPATLSGSTVTITGPGNVTLQASQVATNNYVAATQQTTFTVTTNTGPQTQAINFIAPMSPVSYGTAPVALMASATSGLPVTLRLVSGPGALHGSMLSITSAGTIVIAADQPGNAGYTPAVEVMRSLIVNQIPVGTIALTLSPNPPAAGSALTLTAVVSSPVSTPTGEVFFLEDGSYLGAAPLINGIATAVVSAPAAAGNHSFVASFAGDVNFKPGASDAVYEAVADFNVGSEPGSPPTQTVAPGQTASYALAFSPQSGTTYPDAVTFTASGLPPGATATFTPPVIAAGSGATKVTLSIHLAPPGAAVARGAPMLAVAALAFLVLPLVPRRRLALIVFLPMLLIGVLLCGLPGCGSSSQLPAATHSTPQSYKVMVTATSGHASHTTTVTIMLQ